MAVCMHKALPLSIQHWLLFRADRCNQAQEVKEWSLKANT